MIRLNNEIKNQLCHNLLLASPLFEKAKAAVNEGRKLLKKFDRHCSSRKTLAMSK